MDEKLYDLCDWAGIEAIIYNDHTRPNSILGPHITEDGILFNVYRPHAVKATLKLKNGKEYECEMVDEEGFFAVLIAGKTIPEYTFVVEYEDGTTEEVWDIYSVSNVSDMEAIRKFNNGICYDVYNYLGSHVKTINGIEGTLFTVWAPNVLSISVVGSFNDWKGDLFKMSEIENTGVFELFVPGAKAGDIYKYEMRFKGDVIALKADPYAKQSEVMPNDASVICDESEFKWTDKAFVDERVKTDLDNSPLCIYELNLSKWKVKEDGSLYSFREIAPLVAEYVKKMGYTHIELTPICEYREEESLGYKITNFYAPTSRFGKKDDFKYFIDFMHSKKIGVILDWVPAYFADDKAALADFDGTNLYDHLDPKKGVHPFNGGRVFNYGRPEVSNFLIANAFYWFDEYHVDGLRACDVASMLNLDYGRKNGEWWPNMFGDNHNLEAIEFFKHLNSIHSKREDGTFIIGTDTSSWEKFTEDVEEDGLGFDYKWNVEWANDMMEYMKCDPLFRKGRHNQITLSMLYNYSEKFILELSHELLDGNNGSIINNLPGEYGQKIENFKTILGYMMTHPGKKHMYMGLDMAQAELYSGSFIDWNLLEYENHKNVNNYVKDLIKLYQSQPALYKKDYSSEGFEWIDDMDSSRSIISYIRKTDKIEETLLIICNFTPMTYEGFSIGVPYKGRYKEIFNSSSVDFGGRGAVNPRLKNARPAEYNGRDFYINVTVPPMGISVFNFTPLVPHKESEEEIKEKAVAKKEETKKTETKKTETKKTASKKTIKKTTTKAKNEKN
ncbi:MAG: 1,4-alpha-glucan branching protein GlgB [Lachnospiraceae bacterium]|nr:1,4-alpha-glucan branching protein GlgB [Lachnospiraceae bacterium]